MSEAHGNHLFAVIARPGPPSAKAQNTELQVIAASDRSSFVRLCVQTGRFVGSGRLAYRNQAVDLDWAGAASNRAQRPLFCAVTKAGRSTGANVVRQGGRPADQGNRHPRWARPHALKRPLAARRPRHSGQRRRAALPDPMRQTRHKSTQVALAYLRPADLWRNNVTERVFEAAKDVED